MDQNQQKPKEVTTPHIPELAFAQHDKQPLRGATSIAPSQRVSAAATERLSLLKALGPTRVAEPHSRLCQNRRSLISKEPLMPADKRFSSAGQ